MTQQFRKTGILYFVSYSRGKARLTKKFVSRNKAQAYAVAVKKKGYQNVTLKAKQFKIV